MSDSGNFSGFSEETFEFLQGLQKNNNKAWFEQHRQDYQVFLLQPMKELVSELSGVMLSIDCYFEVRPDIDRTISRIYRDVRFSRDKSPFKTTMWLTFKRPRKDWKDAPAYFFEISPTSYRYGMGLYCATPETMRQFRAAIDANTKAFVEAIAFYQDQNTFVLEGEQYKRIIDKEKSAAIQPWYQKKNLYLVCNRDIDRNLFSNLLVDDLVSGFKMLEPFYHYLWRIKS